MATKLVKLACYEVAPTEPKLTKTFDFVKDLSEALLSGKISDRCRSYSDIAVQGEQEFITKQKHSGSGLFCTFLHLKAGGAIMIQKSFMAKNEFSLEELAAKDEESIAGHIKDYTYFLLTNRILIMKSTRGIPSSDIEIYLNWLLKKSIVKYASKNSVLTLKPRLKKTFDPLTVGSIELGNNAKIGEKETIDTVIRPIVKGLEQILKAHGYDNIETGKIIDATVVLKILRQPQKDKQKNLKALQSILKALKNEETTIKDRKNQIIRMENIKETKNINIPHLATDFPDIAVLETHMLQYYSEVSSQ
jgi:hypothetical protein